MRMTKLIELLKGEEGNAAEYGLIIALVSVVIIGGLQVLGPALRTVFTTVGNTISGAPGA